MRPRFQALAAAFGLCLPGCLADLPPTHVQSKYFLWASEASEYAPCLTRDAAEADAFITRLFQEIGEPLPTEVIAHYYLDPQSKLAPKCTLPSACLYRPGDWYNRDGRVDEIYARESLDYPMLSAAALNHLAPEFASPFLHHAFVTYFGFDQQGFGSGCQGEATLSNADFTLKVLSDQSPSHFEDALTFAASYARTYGSKRFWAFLKASRSARTKEEIDAQSVNLFGATTTEVLHQYVGQRIEKMPMLHCESEASTFELQQEPLEIPIPQACGPNAALEFHRHRQWEDVATMRYRFLLKVPEATSIEFHTPGARLSVRSCDDYCEKYQGAKAGTDLEEPTNITRLDAGTWTIRVEFPVAPVAPGPIRIRRYEPSR